MDRSVIHDWLRSVLGPYGDADRTFADVTSLLNTFPSLSPRTSLYISNIGQSTLLLQLRGTLPIQFRGSTYNIPIELWVPRAYPRQSPMAYVTPTQDMLVRKTDSVELDGLVTTEYEQQWSKKWQTKNLHAFVQACQEAFGRQPPVYAKPAHERRAQAAAPAASSSAAASPAASTSALPSSPAGASRSAAPSGKPPPPLPGQGMQSPAPEASAGGPPLRPPKPGMSDDDSSRRSSSGQWSTMSPTSNGGAYPHRSHQPQPQYSQHPQYDRQQHPSLASSGPQSPYDHRQHHQQQQQQYHPQAFSQPSAGQHWSQAPQPPAQHSFQEAPRSASASNMTAPNQSYDLRSPSHNADDRRQMAPPQPASFQAATPTRPPAPPKDLLDSIGSDEAEVGDASSQRGGPAVSANAGAAAPPPLPPNPQLQSLHLALHHKLTTRISNMRQQLSSSNSQLQLISRDLDAAPAAIEDESSRLRAVRDILSTRAQRIEGALARNRHLLDEQLSEAKRPPLPSREVVLATTIVGEQLISLVASDLALTDTLYHLSRRFNEHGVRGLSSDGGGGVDMGNAQGNNGASDNGGHGRSAGSSGMTLDGYLKWVRILGREQATKRGLASKIWRGFEAGQG
ncbi:unnamed protein product [Jaminaea pallidilutea]